MRFKEDYDDLSLFVFTVHPSIEEIIFSAFDKYNNQNVINKYKDSNFINYGIDNVTEFLNSDF